MTDLTFHCASIIPLSANRSLATRARNQLTVEIGPSHDALLASPGTSSALIGISAKPTAHCDVEHEILVLDLVFDAACCRGPGGVGCGPGSGLRVLRGNVGWDSVALESPCVHG